MGYLGAIVLVLFIIGVGVFFGSLAIAGSARAIHRAAHPEEMKKKNSIVEDVNEAIRKIVDEQIRMNDIPQLVREACKEYLVLSDECEFETVMTEEDILEDQEENSDDNE